MFTAKLLRMYSFASSSHNVALLAPRPAINGSTTLTLLMLCVLWPTRTFAEAPLGYFLSAEGPASRPSMHLGWSVAALSVVVIFIIVVMLAAALVRRRPPADPTEIGKECGGIRFLYISVGISSLALFIILGYTLFTLWAVVHPATTPTLTISVTAYDWWWKVEYDDVPMKEHVVTANEIHIPVGVPVEIRLQSADVIHSFWVPLLAGKTQAIPGQVNKQWIQADSPGIYSGQCSTYCGAQHAHMAFEVVAQSQSDFEAWRAAQSKPATKPTNLRTIAGQKAFMKHCAGCHAVRGTEAAGVFAPDLTHLGSRRLIAAGTLPNTDQSVMQWVQHAQKIKPDSMMPSFTLTSEEADELSAYLATLQ